MNLLYFAVGSIATGNLGASFNKDFFIEGVVTSIPLAGILALLITMIFACQRKMHGPFPFLILSGFTVGIFVFLLPNYFNFLIKTGEKSSVAVNRWDAGSHSSPKYLSAEHFRTTYQGVYYFTKSDDKSGVSGVFYPSENSSVPSKSPVIFEDAVYPLIVSQSGIDPIIEKALGMPRFLVKAVAVYLMWIDSCRDIMQRNKSFFLHFVTFAVPLCLLCLLINFSSWKLASAVFIFVFFMFILTANTVIHILEEFCYVRGYFGNNTLFIPNSNFAWAVFANGAISIVLIILKIWNIFYRRKSEKYR